MVLFVHSWVLWPCGCEARCAGGGDSPEVLPSKWAGGGGVIRVGGHSILLDLLETRHSEGLLLGSPWLEVGELHISVSISAAHYPSQPTVAVSVPSTDTVTSPSSPR